MSIYKRFILVGICLFLSGFSFVKGQETFPRNGVFDERQDHFAFTNATIQVSPDKKIEKGTLVIKKGKIVAVGTAIEVPEDAVVLDLKGQYIYPSFIDLYADYGMSKRPKRDGNKGAPQMLSDKDGAYSWNEALKSEQRAAEDFEVDKKKAAKLRAAGFGTLLSHKMDGIARGSSALVLLGEENEHDMILKSQAAAHYSFSKGSSSQDYPSSLMGAIALLRQTHYNAQWYKANPEDREYNISLEKWLEIQQLPQIFEANHRYNILRADKIGDEFGVQYIFKGRGDEYRRLDAIKSTEGALIIPINFPKAYDVSDPLAAQHVKVGQMLHWELAPGNPAKLAEAGIRFAITMNGLKSEKEFKKQLIKAYKHGLSEADVLKALTLTPAQLMGMEKELGTIEKGKWANFFISSGPYLAKEANILHNFVKGKPYRVKDYYSEDIRGKYELEIADKKFQLHIMGNVESPKLKIQEVSTLADSTEKGDKVKMKFDYPSISFSYDPEQDTSKKAPNMIYRFTGQFSKQGLSGQAANPDGDLVAWSARRTGDAELKAMELPEVKDKELGEVLYPFIAYGYQQDDAPKQEVVLFENATVWTNEKEGILENTNVLISDGKIQKIGKNVKAPEGAIIVDATGKHLTAGIIDEHSHIAIQNGVNEGTQASSAEVRIGDVINSDDVNLYRQLGGGVTMAQLLHGSANPIGGQAALIKFRWGKLPEEMKYENADGFIKFALGENVKQSNWGDRQRTRFPQTRMGVEQVYEDYFTRAREYGEAMKANPDKVRRDIELDAILEILESKRFITCHSYIQSEITMLMRVAERHGFKVNTFTHILEGYKIADKMKEHGAGGSSFSDWWAYKYEVMDAIPYNPKLLNAMGVVTAINSDDAEMGRRLNQEAGKGVKYGGMSEEEAWKMVTLNPAKLLHCDDRVGSIKKGKDADVVLWSDHPMSIYARAEQTYVDGICYYSLEKDKANRQALKAERNRLMKKMMEAKDKGEPTQDPAASKSHYYHCADMHLNELEGINWEMD